jgi:glutamate-1-semialdehyde 2,1-aminomutase
VITGFRLGKAGASGHYQIRPDLYTFGKVIGGGLPVGAYGGSRELMSRLAPEGDVYQAGTLSGNPVAMAAGLATLHVLEKEGGYERLEFLGAEWDRTLGKSLRDRGVHYARMGSIFWTAFQAKAPRRVEDIDPTGRTRYARLHRGLLDRGIYWAPSAYEVGFLSLAQSERLLRDAATLILNAFDEEAKA